MGKIVHKEPKQYLSITEAAAFLGVSRPTIYSQMQSGELPYNQVGARTIRIPLPALVSLQAKQTVTPSKPKLSKHELAAYITRSEAMSKYKIEKTKFHSVLKANGIKAIRYGQKALYPKKQIHDLFYRETYPEIKDWYTSEELAAREHISRKHICATAHKLCIAVKRAGAVCYIDKNGWDNRKLAPAVIEKNFLTADQAKKRYHVGGKTFYDKINASTIEKVKKGNFVYFPIKDLDRLFLDKGPNIPPEIKANYIRSKDALKLYHVGQKRFSAETQAAGVEKVRTEGNFIWYRKDQLDRLFKTLI